MKLWLTRPAIDASALRTELIAQNHKVVIEPLLLIDFKNIDLLELDNVQALIATSRNGVRAAAASQHANSMMKLRLFVVGPGTASIAKALGFQQVVQGPATAADLLPVIKAQANIDSGTLLHLAGEDLAFDLAGELRQAGYHIVQQTVYAARATHQLPASILRQIVIGDIDGVILLSPRTAQIYVNLVIAHGVEYFASRLVHFCMSWSVAYKLLQLQPDDIRVPKHPNICGILALTDLTTA